MANPTTYPDTFPAKEVTTVVTYLRGGGGDLKTTLFDAYVVEGYALGVIVGNPKAIAAALAEKPSPDLSTNEAKATALEGLTAKGAVGGFTFPSWLLPLVIQVITEIVQKLLGG